MRHFRGRCGKLESVIAVLILCLLAAIAAGVYLYSIRALTWQQNDSPDIAAGFSPVGEPEIYDDDNLYEKINGKAPMYQDAGFVKLTTRRFADAANHEPGFELYQFDMGNAKNAFSVFSRQKRADVVNLDDFQFGYRTTNSVYFAYGKYYVELVGFAESQELIETMIKLAKELIAGLPADGKDVNNDIALFPPGAIAGSHQLQLKDAFGFDGLSDVYSAKYAIDEKTVTIFLSKRNNSDDALKITKSYIDFMTANGAEVIEPGVLDFYGNVEIVFNSGLFVAGVHEAGDRNSATIAAGALREHLKKISEKTGG